MYSGVFICKKLVGHQPFQKIGYTILWYGMHFDIVRFGSSSWVCSCLLMVLSVSVLSVWSVSLYYALFPVLVWSSLCVLLASSLFPVLSWSPVSCIWVLNLSSSSPILTELGAWHCAFHCNSICWGVTCWKVASHFITATAARSRRVSNRPDTKFVVCNWFSWGYQKISVWPSSCKLHSPAGLHLLQGGE